MIIVMREGATEDEVQAVIDRMVEMDFTIHRSTGMVHTVLGGVGPEERVNPAEFEEMEGVQECRRIMSPYKLASRQFKPSGSLLQVGAHQIGGTRLWICAGIAGSGAAQVAKAVAAAAVAGASAVRVRTPLRAHDEILQAARDSSAAAKVSLVLEVSDTSEIALADLGQRQDAAAGIHQVFGAFRQRDQAVATDLHRQLEAVSRAVVDRSLEVIQRGISDRVQHEVDRAVGLFGFGENGVDVGFVLDIAGHDDLRTERFDQLA